MTIREALAEVKNILNTVPVNGEESVNKMGYIFRLLNDCVAALDRQAEAQEKPQEPQETPPEEKQD
jgi:hypothetical protein